MSTEPTTHENNPLADPVAGLRDAAERLFSLADEPPYTRLIAQVPSVVSSLDALRTAPEADSLPAVIDALQRCDTAAHAALAQGALDNNELIALAEQFDQLVALCEQARAGGHRADQAEQISQAPPDAAAVLDSSRPPVPSADSTVTDVVDEHTLEVFGGDPTPAEPPIPYAAAHTQPGIPEVPDITSSLREEDVLFSGYDHATPAAAPEFIPPDDAGEPEVVCAAPEPEISSREATKPEQSASDGISAADITDNAAFAASIADQCLAHAAAPIRDDGCADLIAALEALDITMPSSVAHVQPSEPALSSSDAASERPEAVPVAASVPEPGTPDHPQTQAAQVVSESVPPSPAAAESGPVSDEAPTSQQAPDVVESLAAVPPQEPDAALEVITNPQQSAGAEKDAPLAIGASTQSEEAPTAAPDGTPTESASVGSLSVDDLLELDSLSGMQATLGQSADSAADSGSPRAPVPTQTEATDPLWALLGAEPRTGDAFARAMSLSDSQRELLSYMTADMPNAAASLLHAVERLIDGEIDTAKAELAEVAAAT